MEKEQALSIIEQGLNISIGKNIFKAEDSAIILTALITIKNLLDDSLKDKEVIAEEVVPAEVETPVKKTK